MRPYLGYTRKDASDRRRGQVNLQTQRFWTLRADNDIALAVSPTGDDQTTIGRPIPVTGGDVSAVPFLTPAAAVQALPCNIPYGTTATVTLSAGEYSGLVIAGFSGGGTLRLVGAGSGDTLLGAISDSDATCVRIMNNRCTVELVDVGFVGDPLADNVVLSMDNDAVTLDGVLLDAEPLSAAFESVRDRVVTLRDSVLGAGASASFNQAWRVDVADVVCTAANPIFVEDVQTARVTGVVSLNALSSVVRAINVMTLELEAECNDGDATAVYLEHVINFVAVGDALTGTGNDGYGIEIAIGPGYYILTGSTLDGDSGDVLFMGTATTWANLANPSFGMAEEHAGAAFATSAYTKALKSGNYLFLGNIDVSGRLLEYGYHNFAEAHGLTATGSTDSDALQLGAAMFNRVNTVASGTGVRLPAGAALPGVLCIVQNLGANSLTIYGPPSGSVNGGASVPLAAGAIQLFVSTSDDGLGWTSLT